MAETQVKAPARPGQETADQKAAAEVAEKATKVTKKKAASRKLAEKRTGRVLEAIRLLGNLGSANYALSAEQKQEIVDAISNANAELETRFAESYTAGKQSWSFAD